MKIIHTLRVLGLISAFTFMSFPLLSCEGDDADSSLIDDPFTEVPSSVAGKSIRLYITSGSGLHATSGVALIDIENNGQIYTLTAEGGDVIDSVGTLNYTTSGTQGFLDFNDTEKGFNGRISLTYTTSSSGTYESSASQDSTQIGTFAIF